MPRPSAIERLPADLRDRINALLRQKVTLDEIMAKLAELGVADVSRSGLGRYKQNFDRLGERLRERREIANALVEKLGDAPEGKQQRLLIEMMRSLVFDVLSAAGAEAEEGEAPRGLTLDPEAVMMLSRALKDLSSAQKTDADLTMRVRKELAAEAEAKLKSLEADGAKPGAERALDPETLRRVREIYGIPGTP